MKTACVKAIGYPDHPACPLVCILFPLGRSVTPWSRCSRPYPWLQADAFGSAVLIAQHGQAIGIPHSLLREAQRPPARRRQRRPEAMVADSTATGLGLVRRTNE
jgi:hypothetical protein